MFLPLKDVMSMMKLSTIKKIMLKSNLGVNQVRIHNDKSKKGKAVRSLLMEVKHNKSISTEY